MARRGAERQALLLVLGGLAAFVLVVYVVVVLGGGALVGRTGSTGTVLSVLATAVVALGIEPVRSRLQASRWSGRAASPYGVLSGFPGTVTGSADVPEVPARMARLLGEAVSAQWVQVWLSVQDQLVLAATWPPGAPADAAPPGSAVTGLAGPGRREVSVRHDGRVHGVLRLQHPAGLPLTSVEEQLVEGLAAQAGLVLRRTALRSELAARHDELVDRADELRVSRARLIATQDAERRRLERDMHDGAQQHLVALAVNLRLAQTVAARSPERAAGILGEQADAARAAVQSLHELSRGLYPAGLAEQGLAAALRTALARNPTPVLVADAPGIRRLPAAHEAALYFVAMEAVQNATKHAAAASLRVELEGAGASYAVHVRDDGTGFDVPAARSTGQGTGLQNMADRLDVVHGRLLVTSAPGRGTTVSATVPRRADRT